MNFIVYENFKALKSLQLNRHFDYRDKESDLQGQILTLPAFLTQSHLTHMH
jgi:hypothetical protein